MELNEILALSVVDTVHNEEISIRQFFYNLISTLWTELEDFDGKRPFGNSDWEYEIYASLIRHGLVSGALDEDGFVKEIDSVAANDFVLKNILQPLFGIK